MPEAFPWGIVLPLLLAALLLVLLSWFVHRGAQALAQTREIAGFQRDAADLSARIDGTLGQLTARVDGVRRQQIPPAEIQEELKQALDSLATYLDEARAINAPAGLTETRNLIAQDIQRAARAVEMVSYGVRLWTGSVGGRRAELEAQTSIKRGYLNLLHARDSVAEHTSDVAAARDAAERKWRTSRV